MHIVGIDPGAKGAIAVLTKSGEIVFVERMPKDMGTLENILRNVKAGRAFTEEPFVPKHETRPGAIANLGRFYKHCGFIMGLCTAIRMPITEIPPARWQAALSARKLPGEQSAKPAALRACVRIWGNTDYLRPGRCREAHQGIVDALLIAEYGRRLVVGTDSMQ